MSAKYDEAVFFQKLKQLANFNTVTLADVETAFWAASSDVEYNITQLVPDRLDEARDYVRQTIVPLLLKTDLLQRAGVRLRN